MIIDLLIGASAVVLVAAAAIVVYPIVAYRENVIHSRAAVTLAASLVLVTLGTLDYFYYAQSPLGNVALFASTITFTWSQWLFCRDFVQNRDGELFSFEEQTGGFEDARRE